MEKTHHGLSALSLAFTMGMVAVSAQISSEITCTSLWSENGAFQMTRERQLNSDLQRLKRLGLKTTQPRKTKISN